MTSRLGRLGRLATALTVRECCADEEKMVDELPSKLRSEIVLQRYQKTVDRIPFFRNLTEDIVVSICVRFKEFMVLPGDLIIKRYICPDQHTGACAETA